MEVTALKYLMEQYEEVVMFINRKLTAFLAEQLAGEVTAEQFFVLRSIKKYGPCPISMLEGWNNENRNVILIITERLINKGYVIRTIDPQDSRVTLLETTEQAEDVLKSGEEKMYQFISPYLGDLEQEEVESFTRIYKKIHDSIRKKESHSV
ncbi:MarR family winged helix-turn-helix transcriptional regulator [Bacillus sp. 165]|uniref:MarR family winged helix-turn-helix transcriptional regulator n=1 Tax=Bacillus sp. 165 TaxID=1529117 RepID=UPI001ADADABF|nr:MarR family winged helix-turn-helix transcriptional regulator [Bacillus sp. 165]